MANSSPSPAPTPSTAVPCDTLRAIFADNEVVDAAGTRHPLAHHLWPRLAEALYRTVLAERPRLALEVGMAYGISTLAILRALADDDDANADETAAPARLISLDPMQERFHGVGLANVARAGHTARHRHDPRPDYLALPALLAEGTRLDFAYIDGWHTFDYVLLDFFYIDKMLRPGGLVAFNDCALPAVHRAIACALAHRRYEEIDVDLEPSWGGRRRPLEYLRRRLSGRNGSDRYFRKTAQWEPDWEFYRRF